MLVYLILNLSKINLTLKINFFYCYLHWIDFVLSKCGHGFMNKLSAKID